MSWDLLLGTIHRLAHADHPVTADDLRQLLLRAVLNEQWSAAASINDSLRAILCDEDPPPVFLQGQEADDRWFRLACQLFRRKFPDWTATQEDRFAGNLPFTSWHELDFDMAPTTASLVMDKDTLDQICSALLAQDIATRLAWIRACETAEQTKGGC